MLASTRLSRVQLVGVGSVVETRCSTGRTSPDRSALLLRPDTVAVSEIVVFGRLPLVAWVTILDSGSAKTVGPTGWYPSALRVPARDPVTLGRFHGAETETSSQK